MHVIWTRLSFANIESEDCSSELSIEKEFEVILKCFKEVDITRNVKIKNKLHEIVFP